MENKKNNIIDIDHVSFAFDKTLVLEDVDLHIQERDFLGIIGPNGAGKSTLIRLILGFIKPQQGAIRVFGKHPGASKRVGYVPQHVQRDVDFPITVKEVVAMGVYQDHALFPWLKKETLVIVEEALRAVSIKNLADWKFGDLSYGQKQRCLIARAIASKPDILILDEPTASVDSQVEKDIYELLRKLNETQTILLVSHDLGFISSYVNKVACVNREVSCHPIEHINQEIIDACYHAKMSMVKHRCKI